MPHLVSIAGPLSGGVFPLPQADGEVYSIGRAVDNSLCLEDPSVSRRHCTVSRQGGQYLLADRGSANRTYVNGLPREEHPLRHGDEIKVGESLFVFVTEEERAAKRGAAAPLERTIHLNRTQAVRIREGQAAGSVEARYAEALLSIGEAIPAGHGLEDVEGCVLEPLCRALGAEHGTLVLDSLEDTPLVYEWGGGPEGEASAAAILEQMTRDPRPVLWNRGAAGPEPPGGEEAASLVAVPLVAFEQLLGALCFTTTETAAAFDEQQLRFLTKAAGLVAGLLRHTAAAREQQMEAWQRRAEIHLEHNMVGESSQMRKVYETIAKVAPAESTVLIRGESGTGKELAARAIHRNSPRSQKPFIAINCAALAETLLESELFGHEKGAFTGAVAQKKGKLEEAIGGTIFFDEVAEMSPVLQAKLLRVLQEREFERVGGTRAIRADVRILAATNRDLEEAIRRGTFRQDLYFRLNVISFTLPPLRERPEDIEPLANYFAQKHSRKLKRRIGGISAAALRALRSYEWPGNVRELENVIERALVLGAADLIQPEDLPDSVIESSAMPGAAAGSFHATITEAKRRLIAETLQKTNGNHSEAARLLELHPNSLHRIIRNLNAKVRSA